MVDHAPERDPGDALRGRGAAAGGSGGGRVGAPRQSSRDRGGAGGAPAGRRRDGRAAPSAAGGDSGAMRCRARGPDDPIGPLASPCSVLGSFDRPSLGPACRRRAVPPPREPLRWRGRRRSRPFRRRWRAGFGNKSRWRRGIEGEAHVEGQLAVAIRHHAFGELLAGHGRAPSSRASHSRSWSRARCKRVLTFATWRPVSSAISSIERCCVSASAHSSR